MNQSLEIFLIDVGLILVLGFLGAFILKKLGIPQVLGLILSGIVLSSINSQFSIFVININEIMPLIVTLALGIIGFNIGAELSIDELKKVDRKLLYILLADSFGTFLIVFILLTLFTDLSTSFALILASLASATAPAATADVLWEYKSSGPLTHAILFILAIDDIISIFLVQITTYFAKNNLEGANQNIFKTLEYIGFEIGIAVFLGLVFGILISRMICHVEDHSEILELILGALILLIGIAEFYNSSSILAAMVFGVVIASMPKKPTETIFHDVFKMGSPLVAIFFIFVGLEIQLSDLMLIGSIGFVYLFGRTLGKVAAVSITAKLVEANKSISNYLGFCLFSQAGVALGLAVQVYDEFIGTILETEAKLILTTITGTVLIVQIIGPVMVKWAIHSACEVPGTVDRYSLSVLVSEKSVGKEIIKDEISEHLKVLSENEIIHSKDNFKKSVKDDNEKKSL